MDKILEEKTTHDVARPLEVVPYEFSGFYDEKVFDRFIKAVERIVRKDPSYLNYVRQVKEREVSLTRDVVLHNLSSMDATIELHHHPLTLYDIVGIIALHNFNNDIKFTSFSLAKQVIKAHYNNMIGLAPMTTTTHQLAHINLDRNTKKRYINITKNQIFGKYELFVETYQDGLTLDTKLKIVEFEEFSSEEDAKIDQKDLFK